MIITRLLQSIIVLSLLAIVLVLFNSAASSAHNAVFVDSLAHTPNTAIAFDQPDIDRIFYTQLSTSGAIDFYTFRAEANLSFKAKILIPRTDPNSKFRPALALFGPGLPQPDTAEFYSVPFQLPAGNGLVTSVADKTQDNKTDDGLYNKYDEPYTQSNFWEGQTLYRQLPQSGTYYLVVFNPNNQTGKYALEVGDRDATSLKETLSFPVLWFAVHFWFGDWLIPLILVLVLLLLIAALIIARLTWKRRATRKITKTKTTPISTSEQKDRIMPTQVEATEVQAANLTETQTPETTANLETETEKAKIGDDQTYIKWRDGKLGGNLETDFLNNEEETPKTSSK